LTRHCPALLITAPASGQGKTSITAGLARWHHDQGRKVRVFKTGPDFLDPMILARAAGSPVDPLDLWMVGENGCRAALYQAAGEADIILVEGVMGLFDGKPSSADLAERFGIPVLPVIDATAMGQTFGALARGLTRHRPTIRTIGVIANRVASPVHGEILREGMDQGPELLGTIPREEEIRLPSRHLGLVQAEEIGDLETRLERAAQVVAGAGITGLPPAVAFHPPAEVEIPRRLDGVRIGIACDEAFGFIYGPNLCVLEAMGADTVMFSPLRDPALPEIDSLWLPGGYPELHLGRLAANTSMKESIRRHIESGRPTLAECGGMLYLLDSLTDRHGNRGGMVGALPGHGVMQDRVAGLGMQALELPEGTLRGHTFHHSRLESGPQPALHAVRQRGRRPGEPVFRRRRLTATYLHSYFPSSPEAIAALLAP